MSVRPETVRLHPEAGPAAQALVTSVQFRGVYKLLTVRLRSGRELAAVMGLHIPAETGETVDVGVNSFVAAFPVA